MSSILVVETEGRSVERIRDALAAEGWRVRVVPDPSEALRSASSEAPTLVLVGSGVAGAGRLYSAFSRRQGGPGVIALVAEGAGPVPSPDRLAVDEVVAKPFTDQELRLAVRRVLAGGRPAPARGPQDPVSDRKLTSHEIFGDLVAELEDELASPPAVAPAPAAAPAPAPSAAAPPNRPAWTLPPAVAPAPPPPPVAAQPTPPPAARPAMLRGDDIERKLEETLSGVLGRRVARPAPEPPPKPRRRSADVDALLSETLTGLKMQPDPAGARPPAPVAPAPPPPAAPPPAAAPPAAATRRLSAADLELAAIEELTRSRTAPGRPPAAAAEPPAAPAPPPPAAPPRPEPQLPSERPLPPEGDLPVEPSFEMDLAFDEFEPLPSPFDLAPAAAPPPPEPPAHAEDERRFGQYQLLERIAVGGMAEVWKARMSGVEGFQKMVAIKKILPHLTDNADFVTMFIDEAKLAAQLNHPNIIHIYDLGKIADHYYIAMEYVEGMNLRALLNAARDKALPMPIDLGLLIAARLASALDHAHRKRDFQQRALGLVHRDVSPQNVLLSQEGDIKLCDFGIAKAVANASQTQMGSLKGKLQYMSPEQAWGRTVDARSDIFSLGTILFEMLTGRRLFAGDNEISVLEAVRECHVVTPRALNPAIPEAAEAIVLRALGKEPAERYPTAGELQHDLEQLLYALRPTPGPADLAAYLLRLRNSPNLPEPLAEPIPPPLEAAVPATVPIRPATVPYVEPVPEAKPAPPEPPPPSVPVQHAPPARTESTATGSAVRPPAPAPPPPPAPAHPPAAVPAMEPLGRVQVEEGTGRGRWLIVAAILLAAAAAYAAYYFSGARGGRPETPPASEGAPAQEGTIPAPDAALDPAAAPGDAESSGTVPETGDTAGASARTGAVEPVPADVQRIVDEELARREREVRQRLEAEQRRLEQQLAKDQAAQGAATPPAAGDVPPAPPAQETAPAPGRELAKAAESAPAESPAPPPAQEPAPAQPVTEERRAAAQPETPPAAAPPPPSPAAPAVKVGDLVQPGPGVVPPKLVTIRKPEYPPVARKLGVQGDVVVAVLVDENGRVVDSRLEERVPQNVGINEAAVEAARGARYEPATKNGVRVKMWTRLRVPFRL